MVGLSKPELPPYVLLWAVPLFLVHLAIWIALGVTSHRPPLLRRMWLPGPTVSTFSLSSPTLLASLHWPHGGGDLGKYDISYY